MSCDLCGGELMLLGVLGKLTWVRCRNCGAEFSIEDEAEPAGEPGSPYDAATATGMYDRDF